MRARSHNSRVLLGNKPFAGSLGASLYVGTPDEQSIRYRRGKCVCPAALPYPATLTETIDPGAATVPKCLAVAQTTSPTVTMDYTLPAALQNVPLAVQVRTYQGNYENETIYRPVLTSTDAGGDQVQEILGTATILGSDKRDAGGLLVRFVYQPVQSGLQPTEFALVQTSGPGSLADTVITASLDRANSIEVSGLTDATAYGFRLEARNGAVTATLGTVSFMADSAGPADPTGVTATPV